MNSMNKLVSKKIFINNNILTPKFIIIEKNFIFLKVKNQKKKKIAISTSC